LSAGESTIRKGFGFAGSIARKYISINRNIEGNSKQGRYNSEQNSNEQPANQNADHNSYNVRVGNYSEHPKAEYNL
jgi:hypothetical protein